MIRWLAVRSIDNAVFVAAVAVLSFGFILRVMSCVCFVSSALTEKG
jgi:hypothetical protein